LNTLLIVVLVVAGLIVLFFGFQIFMVMRMRRMEGKPAPQLDGKPGKAIKRGKALFYFYSPACGACRSITPVVQKMAKTKKNVFPIDISTDMATARKFSVMATPTTILVEQGTIKKIMIGPQPRDSLQALV